jgi:hypothetical protein
MNSNFIIMNFPRFAGGKFISNCLSLSRYCCPQSPVIAKHLITNPSDYKYRLEGILTTLPPTQNEMINWIQRYEFGDTQFYGPSVSLWQQGLPAEISTSVRKVLNANMSVFLTAHGGDATVRNLLNVCTDATIIKLINHVEFSGISQRLKSADKKSLEEFAGNYCEVKYNILAGPDWPSWKEFESVGYDIQQLTGYEGVADEILSFYNWKDIKNTTFLFDIDNSIFSRTKFLSAMEELYMQLGFFDFNSILVEKFWQSYIDLHIDKHQNT